MHSTGGCVFPGLESTPLRLARWELIVQVPPPVLVYSRVYSRAPVRKGWPLDVICPWAHPQPTRHRLPAYMSDIPPQVTHRPAPQDTHATSHSLPGTLCFLMIYPRDFCPLKCWEEASAWCALGVWSVGKGGLADTRPHPPGPRAPWWSRVEVVPGGS